MTISDEKQALAIMRQCPRWIRCSAPKCLLDLLQDIRDILPGEPKCTLSKSKRFQIGQGTALPLQGLTPREMAARKREENLSDEAKRRRADNLKKAQARRKKSQGNNGADA